MNASATAITRNSNTSFYYSFTLLPRHKREAIHAVYAFCRYTDDIVDEVPDQQRSVVLLRRWRIELGRALHGSSTYPLLNQLSAVARRFSLWVLSIAKLSRYSAIGCWPISTTAINGCAICRPAMRK